MKKIILLIACAMLGSIQAMESPRGNGSQNVTNQQTVSACPICLESVEENNSFEMCTGKHRIHRTCYDGLYASGREDCPVCRKKFDREFIDAQINKPRIRQNAPSQTNQTNTNPIAVPQVQRSGNNVTINVIPSVLPVREMPNRETSQIRILKQEIETLKYQVAELKGMSEAFAKDGETLHKEKISLKNINEQLIAQGDSVKKYLQKLEEEKAALTKTIEELKKEREGSIKKATELKKTHDLLVKSELESRTSLNNQNASINTLKKERNVFMGVAGLGFLIGLYYAPDKVKILSTYAGAGLVGYALHKWGII